MLIHYYAPFILPRLFFRMFIYISSHHLSSVCLQRTSLLLRDTTSPVVSIVAFFRFLLLSRRLHYVLSGRSSLIPSLVSPSTVVVRSSRRCSHRESLFCLLPTFPCKDPGLIVLGSRSLIVRLSLLLVLLSNSPGGTWLQRATHCAIVANRSWLSDRSVATFDRTLPPPLPHCPPALITHHYDLIPSHDGAHPIRTFPYSTSPSSSLHVHRPVRVMPHCASRALQSAHHGHHR